MPPLPRTVVWRLGPAVGAAEIPALCDRLRLLLRAHPGTTVLCDVRTVTAPDTGTVQTLLRLTAPRLGGRGIRLCHVPEALGPLPAPTGPAEALPGDGPEDRPGAPPPAPYRAGRVSPRSASAARTGGTAARCPGRS